jgi:hypothetical protein
MSELLTGRCLNWICFDQRGLLAAHLNDLLEEWTSADSRSTDSALSQRMVLHATEWTGDLWRIPLRSCLASNGIGLAAWSISDAAEFEAACRSLRVTREAAQPVQRLSLLAPELTELLPILLEAGAQTVVSQLPSLQKELVQLLTHARLSNRGYHPLTSGLLERLPWQAK